MKTADEIKKKINVYYIKASAFRVVHADGVYGGISANGKIFAAIFSQRPAIPQLVVNELQPNGSLDEEVVGDRVGKVGIVREVETGLMLDIDTARRVARWLNDKADHLEQLMATKSEAEHASSNTEPENGSLAP